MATVLDGILASDERSVDQALHAALEAARIDPIREHRPRDLRSGARRARLS